MADGIHVAEIVAAEIDDVEADDIICNSLCTDAV